MREEGSVLVGLLWCLALLSVLVIGVLHTSRVDLRVVKNHGDSIQAHYLALAGVERAKALLYNDALTRRRSARHHTGQLYDSPADFKDVPLGRGRFRIFHPGSAEDGGGLIYGITDEESRLNLNTAAPEELAKVYQMTADVVGAIIDWRDEDNAASTNGAETEYYLSLNPPYLPRNGPFQSTRELLMLRGVSAELFAGEDANQNGLLDPEEDDGDESFPPDNRDGVLDAAWSGIFTVDSAVRNVSASGQARVNVQSADQSALSAIPGITPEIARAIVSYRSGGSGQNRLETLANLLDVAAASPQPQPQAPQGGSAPGAPGGPPQPSSPQQGPGASNPSNPTAEPTGPKLISEDLLMEVADDLTTSDGGEQQGLVNVNTASVSVLACLPGVTPELAQAIVTYRKSAGYLPNVAWLLKVPGFNREIFKQILPRVSVRSETFRIVSEGQVDSTGARQRIQAVVRVGPTSIETLSYREDL